MNDLQVPKGALILVGDGRKALFLRNKGAQTHIELTAERVLEQDDPPTREQGTDRPGRPPDPGHRPGAVELEFGRVLQPMAQAGDPADPCVGIVCGRTVYIT